MKSFRFSFLVVIGLFLVCVSLACGDDEESATIDTTATATVTATVTATATAVVKEVDLPTRLDAAASMHEENTSVHFRIEHENGGTEVIPDTVMISSEGAVRGTEALSLRLVAESCGFRVNLQVRVLEGTAWLTNPLTNQWEEEDLAIDALFAGSQATPQIIRQIIDPVLADIEQIRDEEAQRITGTISSDLAVKIWGIPAESDLVGGDVEVSVWLRNSDDRIVQLQIDGPLVAVDADNIVRRITFWDFDVPFEVEAP